MRIIICGSRDWIDGDAIRAALISLRKQHPDAVVVHGAARGADSLADRIARNLGFRVEAHPADWTGRGRAAGPERNQLMLKLGADQVLAFKDDFDPTLSRGGTEHMVRIARDAGVPTWIRSHD